MTEYKYREYINDKYGNAIGCKEIIVPSAIVNQIRADAIEEFVTRFEYKNITDANAERLKPFIYEMHRLAEKMQKGEE